MASAMHSKMESEVCASVGTEMSKSKTESEGKRKHIIVGTEAKHDVGRWRRSAGIGKGVGDHKRDRESEGEGSNAFVDSSYEIEKDEKIDQEGEGNEDLEEDDVAKNSSELFEQMGMSWMMLPPRQIAKAKRKIHMQMTKRSKQAKNRKPRNSKSNL